MKQDLGGGLTLRTAESLQDFERIAEFNGLIHEPELAPAVLDLMTHYPGIDGRDVVLVEDEAGRIVSSMLLIPWTLTFEGMPLRVGEMGMVGTLEPYRRRGLVRAQDALFKRRLAERCCQLSLIQGIPYFYRQFGYEYALPLEGGLLLSHRELPMSPAAFAFRQATPEDASVLAVLYDQASRDLAIATVRTEETWRYLLSHGVGALACETWLVLDASGAAAGYIRLPVYHFDEELTVNEVSRLDHAPALTTLHWLKQLAGERGKPGVRLNVPAGCTLVRLARSLGGHDLGTYAWQVHLPDIAAFLNAIGPVLERRLAASPFVGLNRSLTLCFYRASVTMRFDGGRLAEVTLGRSCDHGLRFPPSTFIPVLFGWRTVEQMRLAYPDLSMPDEDKLLVETLFPPMAGFLYPSY